MDYSEAYLDEVLPRGWPPDALVPGPVKAEVDAWVERAGRPDGLLIARSARWTYAMFSEIGAGLVRLDGPTRLWSGGALAQRAAVGLLDPQVEAPGFAVILTALAGTGPDFEIIGEIAFPRLDAVSVPLAVRRYEIEMHAPHPTVATSACWARCNAHGTWGVLTAGHAVAGLAPGASVPFGGGGAGTLLRSAFQPVDAAFVQLAAAPVACAPLATLGFPTAGHPVDVHTQRGAVGRTVVDVMNTFGVVRTRQIGIHFSIDTAFTGGDSGALVRVASGGEAVGLYRSLMRTPSARHPVVGLVQNFEQATYALDVRAYI